MFRTTRLFTLLLLLVVLVFSACQPIQAPISNRAQVQVFVQGPTLRSPESLALRADGTLVASDYFGRSIVRLNAETGEILERIGTEQGVDIPGNVTIAADDTLYWTAWASNTLCRRSVDGVQKCQVIDDGRSVLLLGSSGPTFREDDFGGRLFARNNALRCYAAWTLRVLRGAERPICITT